MPFIPLHSSSTLGFLSALVAALTVDAAVFQPNPVALTDLAAKLPPKPTVPGPTLAERDAWAAISNRMDLRERVREAEEALRTPLPEMTDDLYLDYSRTGNRRRGEAVLFARRARLSRLAIAECLEQRGRFLPGLEATAQGICQEKTWVLPAHDGSLDNFQGRAVTIDLASSALGRELATIDRVFGDALSADLRRRIREEVDRRVFAPFRRMTAGEQPPAWLEVENNWNAVCLAGVTGAALAAIDSPEERAWFVLAADAYSRSFLRGFTPDGYCSEGVGYWNYGFGHYVDLSETVRRATGGGLDLLARPESVMPALYGFQIEITGGVCPAFADCGVEGRPDSRLVADLRQRLGLGSAEPLVPYPARGTLSQALIHLFPQPAPVLATAHHLPADRAWRTWFTDAGVLICRPGPGTTNRFGAAILGGHNAEHHNHNDVGTFTVVVGEVPVLPDIGAEVYTQRTFSNRRYESPALNSFGHAVPVIAGQLQRTGREAAARRVEHSFTEAEDRITFDLRAAYAVPTLEALSREFVFTRTNRPALRVIDRFRFSRPETFESALLTFGTWAQAAPGVLRVTDRGETVRVEFQGPAGVDVQTHAEPIRADLAAQRQATRIGLRLAKPLSDGTFTLRIIPEPSAPAPAPPPSRASELDQAAQDLAAGRLDAARDRFRALATQSTQRPYVRALAWTGLAEAQRALGARTEGLTAWRQLAEDAALPEVYRDAARRRLEALDRAERGLPQRDPGACRTVLPKPPTPPVSFHVAATGDDAGDGSAARPFRTLERARDAIRALKRTHGGQPPSGGAAVLVAGGLYPLDRTVTLTQEDSGALNAPIVYQAEPGETPVFTGGVRLRDWQPLGASPGRDRLVPEIRDRVRVANLKAAGITDWGDATDLRRRPELFLGGVPQTLARWPDEGFVKTGAILGTNTFKVWDTISGCKDGKFRYLGDRPGTWVDEPDVRLYGYWFWDWYEEYQKVGRIDAVDRSYTLTEPFSSYGYRQDQRYYAVNLLRELDAPGEWYLDRSDGLLYWLPPGKFDAEKMEVTFSLLPDPLVVLQDVSHVFLVGFTFQDGRGDALHIRSGADCLVAGCTIRRFGGDGGVVQNGEHHGVFGCNLHTLGCGGIRIAGGNRQTLVPGRHTVENCTVSDISRLKRTYTPAVHVDGCGQRIAHNLFERMPSSALRLEGNDHLVELNTIRDVVQESDDQGGIDLFGNPLYRGVVLRWNRWADIVGGTHTGAAGIRLDDMISGVAVYGNVFERCGAVLFGGVQIHGGKDNYVDNNLFIDCLAGISFSRWGESRWLEAIQRFLPDAANPVYRARYPDLARLREEADVNVITRNLFVRGGPVFLRDGGTQQTGLNRATEERVDANGVEAIDPVSTPALLRAILFEPIPVSEIGPYDHPWRARAPTW